MTYVGMLLRTADKLRYLKVQSGPHDEIFATKVKTLCPKMAHGVAVFNFLTAGLCSNDRQVLFRLLHLVQALKEASKSCEHHHCDINFHAFYTGRNSNCTLTLVNKLLDQCPETTCDVDNCKPCKTIHNCKAELKPHLDPSCWNGCTDCESMLVDILAYVGLLPRIHRRMMASLRLTLKLPDKLKQDHVFLEEQKLLLIKFGYTEIQQPASSGKSCSVDYERLFVSGRYVKKGQIQLMLERFLERKGSYCRRLFFIQWQYLHISPGGLKHCCELEIREHFVKKLCKSILTKFIKVRIVLEQDPCRDCRRDSLPGIVAHLRDYPSARPQLFSMLPIQYRSVFWKRLTEDGGPVQLKDDLHPFEGRNECMVHKRCEHVRCQEHCLYSKPGKVLAVREAKLRHVPI